MFKSSIKYKFIVVTSINCLPACRCMFSMAILSHPSCTYHIITNFQNGLCCIPHFVWKTFHVDNQRQHRHTHHHCVNNLHVPCVWTWTSSMFTINFDFRIYVLTSSFVINVMLAQLFFRLCCKYFLHLVFTTFAFLRFC